MAIIHTRRPLSYAGIWTSVGRRKPRCFLSLKKWGDDWLAEPDGPQVVFRDRAAGREITYPKLLTEGGKPLRFEDVEVIAGSGAVPFNRKRFGGAAPATVGTGDKVSRRQRK